MSDPKFKAVGADVAPGLSFGHPASLVATWFGVGFLPRAPGTWGSVAALPIAWVVTAQFGGAALLGVAAALFLIGWWASETYVRRTGRTDPGEVVIDEVAGQCLTLVPAGLDPVAYFVGFALFRAFDIMKPWPLRALERGFAGGLGVMADDAGAALYSGTILVVYIIILERVNVLF